MHTANKLFRAGFAEKCGSPINDGRIDGYGFQRGCIVIGGDAFEVEVVLLLLLLLFSRRCCFKRQLH